MKFKSYAKACLAFCIGTIGSTALAQFSYNFDGVTGTYFVSEYYGSGELVPSPAWSTFNIDGAATSQDVAILRSLQTLPLNVDWTISLTYTVPDLSLSTNQSLMGGISAGRTTDTNAAWFDLKLVVSNSDGGANERYFDAEYSDGFAGSFDNRVTASTSLITATISMSYDFVSAGMGNLTGWYGSTQLGGPYNLLDGASGWNATTVDTATIRLFLGSSEISSFPGGDAPEFMNFSATAVPEPGTYAAGMGLLVLGAAGMLRLRQRRMAE